MRVVQQKSEPNLQRVNVLGVGVSAFNTALALATIDGWIQNSSPHYVCVTGVHGVMESQRDTQVRHIHNMAGLVTPDGMPLVWLCKLHGHSAADRVYGPDFMLALSDYSVEKKYKHYLYGGGNQVAEKLKTALENRFPGIQIVGTYTPPFRKLTPEEDADVIEMINCSQADIVWVGLSTPKQERWMYDHREKLNAPVLVGVGAAFDFNAGFKHQSPRWMQRAGLEWFFRLITEPRRLWRRYLINNPLFVILLISQLLGLKKYELNGS